MKFITFILMLTLVGPIATPADAAITSVTIVDDRFVPATLTVSAGTDVTFTNADDDAHTVTASDGTFDSRGLDTGGVWHHSFRKPGVYRYFCQLHPFMKGTIVVQGARP